MSGPQRYGLGVLATLRSLYTQGWRHSLLCSAVYLTPVAAINCGSPATCDLGTLTINEESTTKYGSTTIVIDSPTKLGSLSGYTEIVGNVVLQSDSLNDVSPLQCLESVVGDLQIGSCSFYTHSESYCTGNAELSKLAGLERLASITGNLRIEGNPKLTNLNGLTSLTLIGGDLSIVGNAIVDMSGLDKLETVFGHFVTEKRGTLTLFGSWGHNVENDQLTSLNGLQSLQYAGSLRIAGTNLTTLDGLNNLQAVGNYFSIGDTALTDLSGLDSLSEIDGGLSIASCNAGDGGVVKCFPSNPWLTSLDGATNLSSVGSLYFTYNTALADLHGLAAVQVENDIEIIDNPALPTCEAQWLVDWLTQNGWQGDSVVEGNWDEGSCL